MTLNLSQPIIFIYIFLNCDWPGRNIRRQERSVAVEIVENKFLLILFYSAMRYDVVFELTCADV